MRLGLLGYGNIARHLVQILQSEGVALDRLDVLARAGRLEAARTAIPAADAVHATVTDLVSRHPDLVVEAATHQVVSEILPDLLRAGIPVLIVSVGALADPATERDIRQAAADGGAQAMLSNGAIGGIDMLASARLSGQLEVSYTSRKPPAAWIGTPAGDLVDLAGLTEAVSFYAGTAREAARDYPKNANVAATLALAGAGFDGTEVHLVADPSVSTNIHEVSVRSAALDFTIRLEGKPSPGNPKTSQSTAFALARGVLNRNNAIAI